ncbi:MAG: DHH family phosphoesterase [Nanoarchaeota archaeon]
MQEVIKRTLAELDIVSKEKPIKVISHFDADGITSAAIFSRALQRMHKPFTLQIVKTLDEETIKKLPEDQTLVFLDLASASLDYLAKKKTQAFIFDHHEITQNIPPNVRMVNPTIQNHEICSGAAVAYLAAKSMSEENKDLANLAVIGMVGDQFTENIGKVYDQILKDASITVRKGLLLYPSTRPLDKALEYSTSFYIPGVTGSFKGVLELLRDAKIERGNTGYKSLAELTDEEMSRLITAIMLRSIGESQSSSLIGNLFITKFFNRLEDIREISALINACSRMGHPEAALGFCLGNKQSKQQAEGIYIEYKQSISNALRFIEENNNTIHGKNYKIINAQDKIKDTIIGTAASIMSYSPLYPQGTIIIAMAYDQDRIKVSARLVGKKGRNVRELLSSVIVPLSGEVGGHPEAAGGLISRDKEQELLTQLKSTLEIEVVKV